MDSSRPATRGSKSKAAAPEPERKSKRKSKGPEEEEEEDPDLAWTLPVPRRQPTANYTSYGGARVYENTLVSADDVPLLTGMPGAKILGSDLTEAEYEALPVEEQKKQRRLIRNRLSAQLHRQRQRAHIDALEVQVVELSTVLNEMRNRIAVAKSKCTCGACSNTTLLPATIMSYQPPSVPGILGFTGSAGDRTSEVRTAVFQGLLGASASTVPDSLASPPQPSSGRQTGRSSRASLEPATAAASSAPSGSASKAASGKGGRGKRGVPVEQPQEEQEAEQEAEQDADAEVPADEDELPEDEGAAGEEEPPTKRQRMTEAEGMPEPQPLTYAGSLDAPMLRFDSARAPADMEQSGPVAVRVPMLAHARRVDTLGSAGGDHAWEQPSGYGLHTESEQTAASTIAMAASAAAPAVLTSPILPMLGGPGRTMTDLSAGLSASGPAAPMPLYTMATLSQLPSFGTPAALMSGNGGDAAAKATALSAGSRLQRQDSFAASPASAMLMPAPAPTATGVLPQPPRIMSLMSFPLNDGIISPPAAAPARL